ncbi:UNVERIFIED_CONTAM: Phospholipase SGR2 [Sesamum angustifolium]|uniref:Phospholipase SGR2 n=1 Tax=Sesamum angustifolium TaxID=2727405 RepID=A0AAW2QQR6_9LAMI
MPSDMAASGAEGVEEASPDMLKNTPSNIRRLVNEIEQYESRQKYLSHTRSPSDGGDVRWYFCKVPLAVNELAASVPRTEIVGKGDYFRFGMRDSLAIEASFLQREDELLSSWWKEYAECSEGPRGKLPSSKTSLKSSEIPESLQLFTAEEERVGVPVKGGLYENYMPLHASQFVRWTWSRDIVFLFTGMERIDGWYVDTGLLVKVVLIGFLFVRMSEQLEYAYRSQVPVRHLVFMVHGIGQRLEKSNLVDDVGDFRHVTASLAERHLTSHQRGTQRVLYIPCQIDLLKAKIKEFEAEYADRVNAKESTALVNRPDPESVQPRDSLKSYTPQIRYTKLEFKEFKEGLASRSHAFVDQMNTVRVKVLTICESRCNDGQDEESKNTQVREERSYGSLMMERLTGSIDGRIDHVLQDKTFRHPYLSAIGSHTNYWRDYDTALFILKHLYRDIPDGPISHDEQPESSSKDENGYKQWSDPREIEDEELPLTFADSVSIKNFSHRAKKTMK